VACPYFIPAEHHELELWPHRYRLSLGDGFTGHCSICPNSCDDETLRSQCNIGYAACPHLPADRNYDAVRFLVASQGAGAMILRVQFACERAHLPASIGELRFDQSSMTWLDQPDPQLLNLADAAIRAWIRRSTLPLDALAPDVKVATD